MDNSSFAIAYLYEYNLLDAVLQPSKYNSDNKYSFDNLFLLTTNLYILGEYIFKKMKIFDIEINSDNFNKIDFGLLLLTVCFRNMQVKYGKENTTINKLILRETFKTANEYIKENQIMNENFDELIALVNSNNYERLSIGKLLRKIHFKNIIKILLVGICYDYLKVANLKMLICEIDDNTLSPIIKKYQAFFNYITKENMLHIDELKPLFSGQEIIGLLNLPDTVKDMLVKNEISMTHARILSKMSDSNKVIELANRIKEEGISSHEMEDIARNKNVLKRAKYERKNEANNNEFKYLEEELCEKLDTKVRVYKNKIEIKYNNIQELNRILDILNIGAP